MKMKKVVIIYMDWMALMRTMPHWIHMVCSVASFDKLNV